MQETLTLNAQEQKRVGVLNRILAGQLSAAEAAVLLRLSQRQVQRILATYREEGVAAVVHGNRRRKPKHRINLELRQQVIMLAQTTEQGCTQQHRRDLRTPTLDAGEANIALDMLPLLWSEGYHFAYPDIIVLQGKNLI